MGKITGFLEYERKDKKEINPKERIKNFSSAAIQALTTDMSCS